MGLKNINSQRSGFTIVELLIVVVVIAILAAITIVSYTGITQQANASSAASTANSIMKKASAFSASGPTKTYPRALADLKGTAAIVGTSPAVTTSSSDVWYITGVNYDASLAASDGTTNMTYYVCGHNGTTTAPTGVTTALMPTVVGGQIRYFDYEAGTGYQTLSFGTTSGTNPAVACRAAGA